MRLTKLFYPKHYNLLFVKGSDHELDLIGMKDKNYPEEVIKYFQKWHLQAYSHDYTESIDKTINRWLKQQGDRITVIDIKYSGYADENTNVSVLIIYEENE